MRKRCASLHCHFLHHRHHYKLASDLTIAVMGGWLAEGLPHFVHNTMLHFGAYLT